MMRAARAGIFIKNPDALDRLCRVGTVLLDKTGTLTEGRARLARWHGDPVALEYGFSMVDGFELKLELFRVFLPKPKYSVSGPGGVEASFDWRAAFDDTAGTMLRASLLNDVASYA